MAFQKVRKAIVSQLISKTVTATRNYLAIAPDVTQLGDLVCLCSGFDAPVILRLHPNSSYTLIGDAFIGSDQHGWDLMYG